MVSISITHTNDIILELGLWLGLATWSVSFVTKVSGEMSRGNIPGVLIIIIIIIIFL